MIMNISSHYINIDIFKNVYQDFIIELTFIYRYG